MKKFALALLTLLSLGACAANEAFYQNSEHWDRPPGSYTGPTTVHD